MILGRDSRFKNAYIWWVVIFLIIVVVSFKYPVGQQLNLVVAPLLHATQAPVRWYQSLSLWFETSQDLQYKLEALEVLAVKQQALAQEKETLKYENKQLRELLNISQIQGYDWRVARVISRGPELKSRRLMIEINMANQDDVIVSHEGLIGLVTSTSRSHATIRTILDASVTVPVTMKVGSLAALVRGDGEHVLVDFVPLEKSPQVGDILITSGAGGVFPAGLPVAKVSKVNPVEGGVFVEVMANPVASWKRDAWLAVVGEAQESTQE